MAKALKQLYFLHIPKTAGKFVGKCVSESLKETSLKFYISTRYPDEFNVFDKAYLSGHYGTYPIEKNPSMDVACIVRNPVDARVSYFNFIYKDQLIGRPEYDRIDSYLDKLKYYLFEDQNYFAHNNYQARFICNPADEKSFNLKGFYEDYGFDMMNEMGFHKGKAFTWSVEDKNTSLEKSIYSINSFKIVNTADRLDLFMERMNRWFLENYNQEIKYDLNEMVNTSKTLHNETSYKTKDLIEMLSFEDKELIIKNNYIDYAIYSYVSGKEIQGVNNDR